jgi:molecular chaperone DnaK (HSP70)
LTTASDASLGGRDFDEKLVEYFCKDFQVILLAHCGEQS